MRWRQRAGVHRGTALDADPPHTRARGAGCSEARCAKPRDSFDAHSQTIPGRYDAGGDESAAPADSEHDHSPHVGLLPPPHGSQNALDLDKASFQEALAAGLGRALRDVRSVPTDVRRECLIEACIRHRAFDPQLSPGRGLWLARVIDAAGDTDVLAPRLLAELATIPDTREHDHDTVQLVELAFAFARRGVRGAREALHAALEREDDSVRSEVAQRIVELDGRLGLELVARSEGRALRTDARAPLDVGHFRQAQEILGSGEALDALEVLEVLARTSPDVALYREHVLRELHAWNERKRASHESAEDARRRALESQPWWTLRWPEVEALLLAARHESTHSWCARWGKHRATSDDLEAALASIATATDRRVLVGALRVFQHARLPRLEPRVLSLLDDEDGEVAWFARGALHDRDDDDVRHAALLRLDQNREVHVALDLLAPTYTSQDKARLLRALPSHASDGANHDFVVALLQLLEDRGSQEEVDLLEWGYANSTCEVCRRRSVEQLQHLGRLSPAIADECRFDSNDGVREAVEGGTAPPDRSPADN